MGLHTFYRTFVQEDTILKKTDTHRRNWVNLSLLSEIRQTRSEIRQTSGDSANKGGFGKQVEIRQTNS